MDLKDPSKHGGKPYTSRYIGSLVGDFHRTLLYGGIYGYPGDTKNKNGKLRLLYECAPMSMIAEQVRAMIGGAHADFLLGVLAVLETQGVKTGQAMTQATFCVTVWSTRIAKSISLCLVSAFSTCCRPVVHQEALLGTQLMSSRSPVRHHLTQSPLRQAGGLGSTGKGRVMEVDPTEVHQRVPLFVGSKKEVEYLESFISK